MPEAQKPNIEKSEPFEGLVPGRVVWYHPTVTEERHAGIGNGGPWAATVTRVSKEEVGETDAERRLVPNGIVTLNVNQPVALPIGDDPVSRRSSVPYSKAKEPGCWTWMWDGQATRYRPDRSEPKA